MLSSTGSFISAFRGRNIGVKSFNQVERHAHGIEHLPFESARLD